MSTQHTVFWCFLHVACLYDARRGASKLVTSRSLCSLFIESTSVKNTVCLLLKIVLLVSILNSRWIASWLHIRCDKSTRRNRSELIHCPVRKDQWDCVLNDLEWLGDQEFLVLMDQYNIEIFSRFLLLLSSYSSVFHQSNVEIARDLSEDFPLFSEFKRSIIFSR